MKTFFKNNLIWVFALVLSIGTMSFKLAEKNQTAPQWYNVDASGNVSPGGFSTAPNSPDCNANNEASVCAIYMDLNDGNPFPSTVSQAQANHSVTGYTYRDID